MRSMTGYGRASLERDGRELTLELKTVNHRFLDLNIRLPRALLFLEDGMRKGLNARLARGHVDVFINYRNAREDAPGRWTRRRKCCPACGTTARSRVLSRCRTC